MGKHRTLRQLIFEGGFDARDEHETPLRGYRTGVVAELDDGCRYRVSFFDPVRLKQDLDAEASRGVNYLSEPGLIILPEVTRANMEAAIRGLCATEFFDTLRPVD